jgi:protoporphyrinogen oxidase
VIKTLIDRFRYPRLGPGQLWERVRDVLAERGQPVMMGYTVRGLRHRGGHVISAVVDDPLGNRVEVPGHHFVSSLPLRELVLGLEPSAPEPVRRAARALGYRDFLTVAVMIKRDQVFPDNWVYIHEPGVKVGRIQNFKNWSPDMVPDPATTCLGMEYFCFEGDGLWSSSDQDLVALAGRELAQLGICSPDDIFDGAVVRQQKAYPVYDDSYLANVAIVREYLERALPNLHAVGRNGMHKYNNQDHSMLTALIVARNIATGAGLDPWKVNADAEYHEEVTAGEEDTTGRRAPVRLAS